MTSIAQVSDAPKDLDHLPESTLPKDYNSLVHELKRRAAKQRQPLDGTFELTHRCNLSCRMCYARYPAGDKTCRDQELSADDWLTLAHNAVDNGMLFLLLTGGEVFLRPDFFEIFTPLTRMGLILTLFTNGTLITERVADQLAQAAPSRTEISIYGATSATYEAITGVPGSYARCCAGIEALVEREVPLALKSTIIRQNRNELEAMQQMADNWGLSFFSGGLLFRRPDGVSSEVDDCRISTRECIELEALYRPPADDCSETTSHETAANNRANFYCQAGKAAFLINPKGEMNTCQHLRHPSVPALDVGFTTAWKAVQRYVDSAPELDPVCLDCEAREYCARCPAWSLLETGNLNSPVPYLCDIAFARQDRYA